MRCECFCADGFIDAHELNSILQDLGTTLNPGDLRDMLREMENMAPGAGDSAPMPDSLAPGAPRCPSLPRCDALRCARAVWQHCVRRVLASRALGL